MCKPGFIENPKHQSTWEIRPRQIGLLPQARRCCVEKSVREGRALLPHRECRPGIVVAGEPDLREQTAGLHSLAWCGDAPRALSNLLSLALRFPDFAGPP